MEVNEAIKFLEGYVQLDGEWSICIRKKDISKFQKVISLLQQLKTIIPDMLSQMNKDYRDLIERHLLADLPINSDLDILYKAELERIENIKI